MKRFVEIGAPLEQRLSASTLSRAANAVAALLRVQLLSPPLPSGDAAGADADAAARVRRWPVWSAVLQAAAPGTVVFAALWGAIALRVAYVVLVRVRASRMLRDAHAPTS